MKLYKIKGNVIKKDFQWGEMEILPVGQKGRGRKYAFLPCFFKDSNFVTVELSRNGKPKLVTDHCEQDNRWVAFVSSKGCYTRGTQGLIMQRYNAPIDILTYGYGAYGLAGRVGNFDEVVAVVEDNNFLYIKPSGGRHKVSPYWLYFGKDDVFEVTEEELGAFCDSKDIDVPCLGNFIRLVPNSFQEMPSLEDKNVFWNERVQNWLFEDLDLESFRFDSALLCYSTFKNCNLKGAKFQWSEMQGVQFIDCDLTDTKFVEIKGKYLKDNCKGVE